LTLNPSAWPGRDWFRMASAGINFGLGERAKVLASSTHTTEILVLLLRGLRSSIAGDREQTVG
jgi:VIT1/CCC1 family predicted Fe2+/Mn2+ transporter